MAVRTQENEIIRIVVSPVSVNVVYFKWDQPSFDIALCPSASCAFIPEFAHEKLAQEATHV